jgi:hypothetical protein
MNDDFTYNSAFEDGQRYERRKLMKEAVAGRVYTDCSPKNLLVENDKWNALLGQFENGQQVRIILVKED